MQVAASSLNPTALPSPLRTNTGELPQILGGNAVGYFDMTITRNGLGSGNFAYFRYQSDDDRWELNTNGSTIASFRIYERVYNPATLTSTATNRGTVTGQFAADTPYQVGIRINGANLTTFVNGVQAHAITDAATGLAEATVMGGGDSGITVTNAKIYPLTVEYGAAGTAVNGSLADTADTFAGTLTRAVPVFGISGSFSDTPETVAGALTRTVPQVVASGTLSDAPEGISAGLSAAPPLYSVSGTLGDTAETFAGALATAPPIYGAEGVLADTGEELSAALAVAVPAFGLAGTLQDTPETLSAVIDASPPLYTLTGAFDDTPEDVAGAFAVVALSSVTGLLSDTLETLGGSLEVVQPVFSLSGGLDDTAETLLGNLDTQTPEYAVSGGLEDTPDGIAGELGASTPSFALSGEIEDTPETVRGRLRTIYRETPEVRTYRVPFVSRSTLTEAQDRTFSLLAENREAHVAQEVRSVSA